jgi:hypothetical protein
MPTRHCLPSHLAKCVATSMDVCLCFHEVARKQEQVRHTKLTCLVTYPHTVDVTHSFEAELRVIQVGLDPYPARVGYLQVWVRCQLGRPVPYPCGTLHSRDWCFSKKKNRINVGKEFAENVKIFNKVDDTKNQGVI